MDYKKKLIDGVASRGVQLDMDKILRAYDIARDVHGDQMRQSGEPYISHPVEVALILVGMDCDTDTVSCIHTRPFTSTSETHGYSTEKQWKESLFQ